MVEHRRHFEQLTRPHEPIEDILHPALHHGKQETQDQYATHDVSDNNLRQREILHQNVYKHPRKSIQGSSLHHYPIHLDSDPIVGNKV